MWQREVSPARLVVACWEDGEARAAAVLGVVPLSKTTLEGLSGMRQAHPGKTIVHRSSRDIAASVRAGADAVTVAPLVARVSNWPGSDWSVFQDAVDSVQEWLDGFGDHFSRVRALTMLAAVAAG